MVDVTHTAGFAAGFECMNAGPGRAGAAGVRDFSKVRIASLFAVLLAIVAVPILLNPLPPISDYINHLARMHIIATIGSDPDLHRYYEVDWQLIPNLMMDLIVPLLARTMNIYLAGQAYTLLS